MPITVKTFLYRNSNSSGEPEVRRFELKKVNMAYLESRIKGLYQLWNEKLQITWKDSDGDSITCKTNAELRDATKEVNDGVLKLYINIEGDDEDEEPQNRSVNRSRSVDVFHGQPDTHPMQMQRLSIDGIQPGDSLVTHLGINCDKCYKSPIRGVRWKCSVCPNYDLCQGCKNSGCHRRHNMIEMAEPDPVRQIMLGLAGMVLQGAVAMMKDGSDSSDRH